ncbi:MAG TPA: nucleotidyl transferase AbiEii/AbiGii toxin family protein, partial [Sphingobacteriaceae bacterium]|nr:nucleotidyl transferase AbiEii/AbiGii toxin family protein [Sphingobacteriaceae bacterium]
DLLWIRKIITTRDKFSEDIDLSIDREVLGFDEDLTKTAVKRLKKAAAEFTSTVLRDAIEKQLAVVGVSEELVTVTADPISETMPDTDPQVLRVNYKSLLDPVPYIADYVKIEVSARSLKEPGVNRPITSLLGEYMPGLLWSGEQFNVPSVLPKRTFLEKVFLLHEEFLQPVEQINYNRMSRHLYDIERLMDTEHATDALSGVTYYESIVLHRRNFIFKRGVDYDTHHPQTISFVPPEGALNNYKSDYAQMREQMFYNQNVPEFEALIDRLNDLKIRIIKLK